MKNLNEMTSKELKEVAKELKVKSWWTLSKSVLIEEIEKIQNASDEEKAARNEELEKEKKLAEHYNKNWRKYGTRNNWTKFLEDYKAGKITLIEDSSVVDEKHPETDSGALESIEEIVGQDSLEDQERDEHELVPMPGTDGDWGKKHWGSEETEKPVEKPKEKKSRGKLIEFDGKSMNLNEWAKELNMTRQTLYARLYIQGWDVEKAFTTPGKKAKGEA